MNIKVTKPVLYWSILFWPATAASITVALFLLMGYLISPQGDAPTVDENNVNVVITRTDRDEMSRPKGRRKPVKPKPVKIPPPQKIARTNPVVAKTNNLATSDFGSLDEDTGLSISTMDRRATPVVRIPPQYPHGPLSREIEGWVLVEFSITRTGTVEDIKVVDSDPPNTFNRAAIRAIKRWKYQPQMLNGKAIAQHNMREIFKFEISDEQRD